MKLNLFKNSQRGHANHGWLKTYHSFSFANYRDYDRIHFGALRVLNDDTIEKGAGFGAHPHQDMEIITIPLEGTVAHKDTSGGEGKTRAGEIQVMSAGTGLFHSEYNGSETDVLKLLQIWIMPKNIGIKPRYDQNRFDENIQKNTFQLVVSPKDYEYAGDESQKPLWINQDAYLSIAQIDSNSEIEYKVNNPQNGVFVFLISGEIEVFDTQIDSRDSLEISELDVDIVLIKAKQDSKVLVIEVPMIEI